MQLMADKLICSLAIEGELTDKGLAAFSETSDSMAKELAKMLIEKSESGESRLSRHLGRIPEREVQMEVTIQSLSEPSKSLKPFSKQRLSLHTKSKGWHRSGRSGPIEGQFIMETKKVTHIEMGSELDEMLKTRLGQAQLPYSEFVGIRRPQVFSLRIDPA
jgi:hypothetical protein